MAELGDDPAFRAPPLSCDTHFHVFGTQDRYPVRSSARYSPPEAPLATYLRIAAQLGIERMVLVQPSAYGQDNSCMLDAMSELGDAARGIVDIPEDLPDAEIEALHRRGVRGVRINTSPYASYDERRAEELIPRVETLASRLAGSDWCIEFLGPGWLTEALKPVMHDLSIDYIVDHMGLFLARDGINQRGFQDLLRLTESGRCWVKLTGVYRMSQAPDFADAAPFAHALAEAAPDRLLWGSDYPHISFEHLGTVELFNLLAIWLSTEKARHKVLVENPARLFGYA